MDAPEEDLDIKLQQISHDLIADFDRSLSPYLRKPDGTGGTVVRSRVRVRETTRIMSSLLDPFQELPQLLDQHLPRWLPLLAESFLEYLVGRKRTRAARSTRSDLLMPLSTGICKVLYTFCKIRGEKVVVRFLNNETKYLELLASSLEECERHAAAGQEALQWSWEERYMVLLWLSHLFLAPFDLSTISSVDVEEEDLPSIPGLTWPARLPGITVRVLPLAIKYLESPGKERDAAKALLVRIAMRRDMQALGVLDALVRWALLALRPKEDDRTKTPYYYIGVLSFLAGLLSAAADTSDMTPYLTRIFHAVYETSSDTGSAHAVASSALARKMMIKVIRSVTVLVLRGQGQDQNTDNTELVETTIGYLLESLADNDTPVRLAASKALSIITLKLDVDMASQVVEAVIDSLSRNVLWTTTPSPDADSDADAPPTRTRDLSAVDPLEWHGLMMTLAHLLYRRSPPAENLSDIVNALLLGLAFEQRSLSGGAIGTNVRDAACFGIWALARRYTTAELLAVPAGRSISSSSSSARRHRAAAAAPPPSVLQVLATELVMAGALDPAGNIRRGASAALQELVGRHPDTVEAGIAVVQTVDYHAVALRARATGPVALAAARLHGPCYGEALLEALLTWRGVGDADAAARRAAAASFGALTAHLASQQQPEEPVRALFGAVRRLVRRIRELQARQVEERHGLLLALAAALDTLPVLAATQPPPHKETMDVLALEVMAALEEIMADCRDKNYRRPELVAEAAGRLVVASFPVLQAAVLGPGEEGDVGLTRLRLLRGSDLVASDGRTIEEVVYALDHTGCRGRIRPVVSAMHDNLREWLKRSEDETIAVAAQAGLVLLCLCEEGLREEIVREWAASVGRKGTGTAAGGGGGGYFAALGMAYPITATFRSAERTEEDRTLICRTMAERWANDTDIPTRVAILKSLAGTEVLRQNAVELLALVEEGLDDYTTNARGDVGSLVRLQAIRAARSLWQMLRDQEDGNGRQGRLSTEVTRLFPRILRLAAEKLDRVRVEAQATLTLALVPSSAAHLQTLTFSSRLYFQFLLSLIAPTDTVDTAATTTTNTHLHPLFASNPDTTTATLLSGYVTSADTGNEDLVIASRAALADFCGASAANLAAVRGALHANLARPGGGDRVAVPTLEVVGFLLHAGLYAPGHAAAGYGYDYDYGRLCLLVQKAGYKSGNVRKIEACARVYGAVAGLPAGEGEGEGGAGGAVERGREEARRRLGALLLHPWPRVRSAVVDELWGLVLVGEAAEGQKEAAEEALMGVDWGKADKAAIKGLVGRLGLT